MLAVIAITGGAYVLLGTLVALAAGFAAGWYGRRLGEAARKQALDAYFVEVVKVAEKARDRAREETAAVTERLERVRAENETYESNLHVLTTRLRKTRDTAAGLKEQVAAGASNGNGAGGTSDVVAESARAQTAEDDRLETIRRMQSRIAELEERLHATAGSNGNGNGNRAPRWLMPSPDGDQDDLKVIKGLGPVLERSLNQLGVFHYRQLAALTSGDVEWLTTKLRTFPGRIERDRWVEQARTLAGGVSR